MIQWNNKLIRINGGLCEYHEPPAPSYTILDTIIEPNYSQYCWVIPIDILINCQVNNLVLDMTAYTTETGTGGTGHAGFLALASTTGWDNNLNGNDTVGFNGYPVGQYANGSHNNNGYECHFWSSNNSIRLLLSLYTQSGTSMISGESTNKGYSVRLVKDVT